MTEHALIAKATAFVEEQGQWGQPIETGLPGLAVYASRGPTDLECIQYEPVACLILQGGKETNLGDRTYAYRAGASLIVSHDVQVYARVTEASHEAPYVALILILDLDIVRSLYGEVSDSEIAEAQATSIDVCETDSGLYDAMSRYFALLDTPAEAKVLGPLILKEMHFRLLTAPHGGMLRNLIQRNSHASRITRAIAYIRQDFANPLAVADLADDAGMSASSFHEHFKSITATTPLQYQKDLRLMEARRLLMSGQFSVSTTAYEVGYESPTQFSHEYSRKFGVSPRRDRQQGADAVVKI